MLVGCQIGLLAIGLPLEYLIYIAKSILCAIDFSESSLNALKYAADLSARYNSHLTVLYPYRLLPAGKEDVMERKTKTWLFGNLNRWRMITSMVK